MQKAAQKALQKRSSFQYTLSNGRHSLREKIADFYTKEGFETKADQILITTGSQQALFILAKFFQQREIVIEKPSYLGEMGIFRMNSLTMLPVYLEKEGVEREAFETAYKNAKLAYLIPDFQNPMGTRYSMEKRKSIASFIQKEGGYLIEDAPYSNSILIKKCPQ